jgi:hypothetical protein
MKTITKVTKKDLANYQEAMDIISDYPLYASTCGLTRAEAIAISRILELGLDNDTEFKITMEIKEKGGVK